MLYFPNSNLHSILFPFFFLPHLLSYERTANKDNKKLFFEQMGYWYTQEGNGCNGIDCCLPQANITCHYKDKPSKIPCKNSPPIDRNGKSFWK